MTRRGKHPTDARKKKAERERICKTKEEGVCRGRGLAKQIKEELVGEVGERPAKQRENKLAKKKKKIPSEKFTKQKENCKISFLTLTL